jgi:outer membrane protein insertion porin family
LGGNVRYLSNTLSGGYYHPLSVENAVVLNVRAKFGHLTKLGKPLRVADRFSMGGSGFRGFGEAGIGPRDVVTQDGIGGKQFAVGTVEVSFPLGLPKEYDVKGVAFTDVGSLWKSGEKKGAYAGRIAGDGYFTRVSGGVGVRWRSPLGLIGVSFAKAFRKIKGVDKVEVFRLIIGSEF